METPKWCVLICSVCALPLPSVILLQPIKAVVCFSGMLHCSQWILGYSKKKNERPLWTTTSAYLTTLYVSQDLVLQSYSKLNIPLTASLPLSWTGRRRSRERSRARPPPSKVCRGNKPLRAHLHLFVMPTGHTSTPSTHAYFWLAYVYNASITPLSPRGKATASFVERGIFLFIYFRGWLEAGVN